MCLGLCSFCLAVCAYSNDSEFVPGQSGLQMMSALTVRVCVWVCVWVWVALAYGRELECVFVFV